jgi:hypothetical protein
VWRRHTSISHVPYVKAHEEVVNGTPIVKTQVAYGTLISTLDLAGDKTTKPANHVALWAGDYPCDSKGSKLINIVNEQNKNEKIREREAPEGGNAQEELVATFSFLSETGSGRLPRLLPKNDNLH